MPDRLSKIISAVSASAPPPKYIRAYHGSPHDWNRVDMSKIGTGEGAQAYGHGFYASQAERVARRYRDALSGQLLIDGQPVTGREPSDYIHIAAAIASGKDVSADVAKARVARDHWASEVDRIRGVGHDQDGVLPGLGQAAYRRGLYQDYLDAYEMIRGKHVSRNKGHMYELEIGYPEESLLDLEAPATGPHKAALLEAAFAAPQNKWQQMAIEEIASPGTPSKVAIESLLRAHNAEKADKVAGRMSSQAAVSDSLFRSGVPGSRYFDGGSRAAGEGTRNYVMFPGTEDSIRILRKFGLLAPMAVGGMQDQ